MLVQLDIILIVFDSRDHKSKFKVTGGGKIAIVVDATSKEDLLLMPNLNWIGSVVF